MNEKIKNVTQNDTRSTVKGTFLEKPYLYKEAGIMEGHGKIPLWLKLVAIGLIFWSVYYTIKYWNIG